MKVPEIGEVWTDGKSKDPFKEQLFRVVLEKLGGYIRYTYILDGDDKNFSFEKLYKRTGASESESFFLERWHYHAKDIYEYFGVKNNKQEEKKVRVIQL